MSRGFDPFLTVGGSPFWSGGGEEVTEIKRMAEVHLYRAF